MRCQPLSPGDVVRADVMSCDPLKVCCPCLATRYGNPAKCRVRTTLLLFQKQSRHSRWRWSFERCKETSPPGQCAVGTIVGVWASPHLRSASLLPRAGFADRFGRGPRQLRMVGTGPTGYLGSMPTRVPPEGGAPRSLRRAALSGAAGVASPVLPSARTGAKSKGPALSNRYKETRRVAKMQHGHTWPVTCSNASWSSGASDNRAVSRLTVRYAVTRYRDACLSRAVSRTASMLGLYGFSNNASA